jgi:DNA-binding MarR family transcriptional regulator
LLGVDPGFAPANVLAVSCQTEFLYPSDTARAAFVRTLEDRDLLYEIGYHQSVGKPLSVKHLLLLGLGSVATVQRRLRHLRRAGAIRHRRSRADRRALELTLAPKVWKQFAQYAELVGLPRKPPSVNVRREAPAGEPPERLGALLSGAE